MWIENTTNVFISLLCFVTGIVVKLRGADGLQVCNKDAFPRQKLRGFHLCYPETHTMWQSSQK